MVHVKICGVTSADDARACVELGASAIGVNFVATSPRRVDVATARDIARAVRAAGAGGKSAIVVGVVAGKSVAELRELVRDAELDCLQLHGDETPEDLASLLPHAYKAVRIGGPEDVARARAFPGEYLLVDAKVEGAALGGTGATFDWGLVRELARERRLTVAGGLHAGNVADAVRALAPYCVDVASGVERAPGVKDLAKVKDFIDAVRRA